MNSDQPMVWAQGSLGECGVGRDVVEVVTTGVWEARILPGSVAHMLQGCLVWVTTPDQDVAERGFRWFLSHRVSTRHEIVY